jgi:hypothetical protein
MVKLQEQREFFIGKHMPHAAAKEISILNKE